MIEQLLKELPVTITEEEDGEELVLHLQRFNDANGESWGAFYAPEYIGEVVNGTLNGAGRTLDEALSELKNNLPEFEKWKAEQQL